MSRNRNGGIWRNWFWKKRRLDLQLHSHSTVMHISKLTKRFSFHTHNMFLLLTIYNNSKTFLLKRAAGRGLTYFSPLQLWKLVQCCCVSYILLFTFVVFHWKTHHAHNIYIIKIDNRYFYYSQDEDFLLVNTKVHGWQYLHASRCAAKLPPTLCNRSS